MLTRTLNGRWGRWLGLRLLLVLALFGSGWGAISADHGAVSPDEKIQAMIRRLVHAENEDDPETRRGLNQLKAMAKEKPDTLVPQLILFKLRAKDEQAGWGVVGLMLVVSQWDREVRLALVPLLDSRDEAVRREAFHWLTTLDGGLQPGPAYHIRRYRPVILRNRGAPPPGLVKHLFNLSPGEALLFFGKIYLEGEDNGPGVRSLRWSDHLISTAVWRKTHHFLQPGDLEAAREALESLSRHEGWYARRYAVEMINRNPGLGTPTIVRRLRKDAHPLVREAAESMK